MAGSCLLAGLLTALACCACIAGETGDTARNDASMRVTLLGTGTPAVRVHRQGGSTLVEAGGQVLLFDAGRGTTMRLKQAGIAFGLVDKLFLTHLHSDHITGLPELWLTRWVLGRHQARPMQIWGPDGTSSLMANLTRAFDFDIGIRANNPPHLPPDGLTPDVTEITEGVVFRGSGITVTAFDVNHHPVKPAFGFRIDFGGHSVVISGDTMYSENLIKHAQGADLLIHEVAYATDAQRLNPFWEGVVKMHTSPADAGRVFSAVQPRLAVYTHVITADSETDHQLIPATAETYPGPVVVGMDLMIINVGEEVRILEQGMIPAND